jgi:hypothetical protein
MFAKVAFAGALLCIAIQWLTRAVLGAKPVLLFCHTPVYGRSDKLCLGVRILQRYGVLYRYVKTIAPGLRSVELRAGPMDFISGHLGQPKRMQRLLCHLGRSDHRPGLDHGI